MSVGRCWAYLFGASQREKERAFGVIGARGAETTTLRQSLASSLPHAARWIAYPKRLVKLATERVAAFRVPGRLRRERAHPGTQASIGLSPVHTRTFHGAPTQRRLW